MSMRQLGVIAVMMPYVMHDLDRISSVDRAVVLEFVGDTGDVGLEVAEHSGRDTGGLSGEEITDRPITVEHHSLDVFQGFGDLRLRGDVRRIVADGGLSSFR